MNSIETVTLRKVSVQANGIIRNERGYLIGRLVDDVGYESEHVKGISEDLEFVRELSNVINKYSKEGLGGNTPDFILASLLAQVLGDYGDAVRWREALASANKKSIHR